MSRGPWPFALGVVTLLLCTPTASAAVTFGADLTQDPDGDIAGMLGQSISAVTLEDSSGVAETGSPIAGVLVSARVKTGADANSTLVVRVLRETGVETFLNVGPEIPMPVPERMTPTVTEVTGLHHPIAAGDLLGVNYTKTDNFGITRGVTGMASSQTTTMAHPVGTSVVYGSQEGKEVLVQGTVEPDADGDAFGDESQDQCVGSAGSLGGCPPAINPSKKKKCKKRKKAKPRADAAKRKKCRKKKR